MKKYKRCLISALGIVIILITVFSTVGLENAKKEARRDPFDTECVLYNEEMVAEKEVQMPQEVNSKKQLTLQQITDKLKELEGKTEQGIVAIDEFGNQLDTNGLTNLQDTTMHSTFAALDENLPNTIYVKIYEKNAIGEMKDYNGYYKIEKWLIDEEELK